MCVCLYVNATRDAALRKMVDALAGYQVVGVDTNIEFLRRVGQHPVFVQGGVGTGETYLLLSTTIRTV